MSGYDNANGDKRDYLDRYLPTPFRTSVDGSDEHNAFLGALKGMIVTTEKELSENVKQIYLEKATGKFLDLYGKWVGVSRRDSEYDESYRGRIKSHITKQRGTISAIVDGIRDDLQDDAVPVSIYEPWRNIFILNSSLLNGPDKIMGQFYRYAVIQVTIGKYVDIAVLKSLLLKYKAYGIKVFYVYSNQLVGLDDLDMSLCLDNVGNDKNIVPTESSLGQFSINDLPNSNDVPNLFIINKSKFNGSDVISGSPDNTFSYQYGTVPSKNIFGVIDKNTIPSSYTDPYEYVYRNTIVPYTKSPEINFNLISNTSDSSYTRTKYGTVSDSLIKNADGSTSVHLTSSKGSGNLVGFYIPYLQVDSSKDVTVSLELKGSYDSTPMNFDSIRLQKKSTNGGYDVMIGSGVTSTNGQKTLFIYFDTTNKALDVDIKSIKVEYGKKYTGWYPSSSDKFYKDLQNSSIYPYKKTAYFNMGRKDLITEPISKKVGSLPTFVMNIKEYLKGNKYNTLLNGFSATSETGVILDIVGSPYGTSRTSITVKSRVDNSILTGKWYEYSNGDVGSIVGDYIEKSNESTKSYIYQLDKPGNIGQVIVDDYYPYSGATRNWSIANGNHLLRVLSTDSQVTGNITIPSLSDLDSFLLKAYIKSIYIDALDDNLTYSVYDYTTNKWNLIKSNTNIKDYIIDGDITKGAYVLIRANEVVDTSIDYFGLIIDSYETQEGAMSKLLATTDNAIVDNSRYTTG